MTNNYSPTFIGIGAEKAGTTWLADALSKHPDIFLSTPKEIFYFNERDNYRQGRGKNINHSKPLSWYKKFFKNGQNHKQRGEFCTAYMYDQKSAALIKKTLGKDIKILACLRHPAERTYSSYVWGTEYSKKETRPAMQALKEEPELIDRSLYYRQLKPYFDTFGADKIFLAFFEDIKDKPQEVIKDAYEFLGVDAAFMPEALQKNSAKTTKNLWLKSSAEKLVDYMSSKKSLQALREKIQGNKLIVKAFRGLTEADSGKEKMSEDFREYVIKQTLEDTDRLAKLTRRGLDDWKR